MNKNRVGVLVAIIAGSAWIASPAIVYGQITFEDVSDAAGITGGYETWGGTIGDYNGDNWPDIFNQGHRDYPRFFRNTGEGTFEDIAYEVDPGNWIDFPFDDKHGASFADFDNDGDEDLLIAVSATGPAMFLVNYDGTFVDEAVRANLDNDDAARLGVWFDYNDDGHLDVMQVHTDNAFLRYRDPDDRTKPDVDFDTERDADFNCSGKLNYAQLIDLDGDGHLDVVCAQEGVFPVKVYDYEGFPWSDISYTIPTQSGVNDSIVGDFNNDLLYDMVLTRGAIRPSGAALSNPNHLEAWLRKDDAQPSGKGFYFESPGEITVLIDHRGMGVYQASKKYVLSPTGQTLGDAGPVRVQWLPGENRWHARVDTGDTTQAYFQIDAVEPITNLVEDDLDPPEFATETMHLVNGPGGLQPTYISGLYEPMFCVSGVAADFDNDMDKDLYLVCRRGPENLRNRYYDNQGDGTFVEIMDFGGEGPVGVGLTEFGVGESVVAADYDVDGFVDLYITNGLNYYPVGVGGPDTLLRNQGNGNHWLQIDMLGVASNRDGVGAKVYVTAGGVTQLREQNGGYHRWSQSHQRLHFGLGGNLTADILIEWPSGEVDSYNNVAADQLYDAMEGVSLTPAIMGPPLHTALQPGDECGEPPYDLDYGPVLFLYKNCGTDVWSLRAKGGRYPFRELISAGSITGDAPFADLDTSAKNPNDIVENSDPQVINFSIGSWWGNSRGFDFSTDGQTESCFNLTTQEIPTLIVGGSKKKIVPPFDLVTLGECATPPPPPSGDGPECGNPGIAAAFDNALFAWRDCAYTGSGSSWTIGVVRGGGSWAPFGGIIESDTTLSATGIALETNDVLDSVPGDNEIDFELYVGGTGQDYFQLVVPEGSSTCLVVDDLPPGAQILVGGDRMPMSGGFDLLTLESCDLAPPPPVDPVCGAPTYDAATEPGIYVWRDCDAPGPDQQWSVRVPGGGLSWSPYIGTLTSQSVILSATGDSLEPHDTLDSTPGDGELDFALYVGGSSYDGFNMTIPAGAGVCFDVSTISGGSIQVGADRQIMAGPFDMQTLGACP